MRLFLYEPFQHIPREQCTVGALRAQAAGHDISVRPGGKKKQHATLATDLARIGGGIHTGKND